MPELPATPTCVALMVESGRALDQLVDGMTRGLIAYHEAIDAAAEIAKNLHGWTPRPSTAERDIETVQAILDRHGEIIRSVVEHDPRPWVIHWSTKHARHKVSASDFREALALYRRTRDGDAATAVSV